ncbi:unnamed protein product [Effrenium voratum]|nr:unnamed protein product [Effrenium voratum]
MAAMDSSDNGASSSDSNSGSFKATGRGRCRALRIFWEYPDLAKTTIGAGFLIACLLIGTPLVLNELKVQVWKKNMSSYGAAVQLLSGVVAVAFGGMFGRVSDRIDRRCAFCLCGLLVFMPWYALLLLPKNSTALYAWSALTIVSGATCMTISGCPMINTFVCDVAPVKERELAFGVATALAFAWTILCWVGAGAIAKQYPGEKEPILWYIFFLSLAFYFSICSVRLKGKLLFSCCDRRAKDLPSCSENEVSDSEDEETGPDLVTQSTLASDMSGVSCKREATGTHTDFAPSYSLIAPFRLACQIPSLRNACLTAGLLALPEVALVDVTMQYYYTELGILEDAAKQQMVSGTNLVVGLTSAARSKRIRAFGHGCGSLFFMVPKCVCVGGFV